VTGRSVVRRPTKRGTVLDHSGLVRRFKRALGAAGLREVRFHDLRHTFGTRIAAAGVPMCTLQEWMGHRDFKTTLIYADYSPSSREAELIERAFGQALDPDWTPGPASAAPPPRVHDAKPRVCGGLRSAPERIRTSTDHTVHKALNLARLPVPPQARGSASIAGGLPRSEAVRGPLIALLRGIARPLP
jgi:hypothetical protein